MLPPIHPFSFRRLARGVAVAMLALVAIAAVPVALPGGGASDSVPVRSAIGVPTVHAITDTDIQMQAEASEAAASKADSDSWFTRLIKELMYTIIQFFGWMTGLLFKVLEMVAQYNGFTTEPIVVKGWTIVRDVCNMFFVFAMLLIAFGTILRIQAYHYRSLLFKVVLMAVLMNLSKSIVGVLIDLSQIVMLSFVSGFKHMVAGSMAQALGIDKILKLAPTETDASAVSGAFGVEGSDGVVASAGTLLASFILAALIMALIFITVLAITVQLIVRVIKLWILTIMAPIAFAGTLFKGLGSMAGKWWDELTKELVAGPMLMFFLWLVLAISTANDGEVFNSSSAAGSFNPLNLEAASAGNLVNLFVVVGLLWAGLGAAKAGGTAAAGAVGFGLGKLTSISRGSARLAGKGAAGVGRFGQRWTAQGLSKSGVQARYEMAKEGIRESTAGKAVRFLGKEATEQRWAARKATRRERILTHMDTAAKSADLAGQPVGWIQSARRKREQKWRVESNVATAKYTKELDEQGINDNASIRAALASNQKDGKVLNVDKQAALLRQLASKGKVLDANRDIVENTAGMSDGSRAALLAAFKDHDTSSIKSDGSIRSDGEVMEEMESAMKGDADRGAKNKRVRGIAAKVRVDEKGQVANSTAIATLRNLDEDYIEPLDKKVKDDVKEAILLTIHNANQAGDTKLHEEMTAKYKQLFGDKDADGKEQFDSSGQIKDAALIAVQQKAAGKQERDQIKEVSMKRESLAPLDEGEQAFKKMVEAVKGAPAKLNELRAALADFSTLSSPEDLNLEDEQSKGSLLLNRIQSIQNVELPEMIREATKEDGTLKEQFTYRDRNGQLVDPEALFKRMSGGDIKDKVKVQGSKPEEAQRRASDQLQGVSARVNRVQKVAPSKGATSAGSSAGRARDTRYLAGEFVQPRQAVSSIADPLVSKAQGAVRQAFQQIEQGQRVAKLEPVLKEVQGAIKQMLAIDQLDEVQKKALIKMQEEAEGLSGNLATASEANVSALVTKLGKLKNLA